MILEKLTEDLNSFGPFQLILIFFTTAPKAMFAWSMMIPAFAGVTPDWWCVPDGVEVNETSHRDNTTFKKCHLANETSCKRVYADTMSTIVSEWDLVCENHLISKTITSIQMAGVLIGAVLAGQIADSFGRKKIFFLSMAFHTIFELCCAFSVNWQMYAVLRFFIGLTHASYTGTYVPHTLEFIGNKWRPFLPTLPVWVVGVVLLVGFAYVCPIWSYFHITNYLFDCMIIVNILHTFPECKIFGLCRFVPESLRWLTVKGRVDEAEAVVDQIVKYNKRSKPADTRTRLEQVAQEELSERKNHRKYSYLDTVRGWTIFKTTLCCSFAWFSSAVMYYGVAFGVSGLSGNIYLNMFLLTLAELPGHVFLYWQLNIFGRKWTSFGFFLVTGIAMLATFCVHLRVDESSKGTIVNGLAIVGKFCITGGWMSVSLLTNELYPTVIRSMGFAVSHTASGIGGIVAPMILLMDEDNIVVPFVLMGAMMMINCVCLCLLRETKNRPLQDILTEKHRVLTELETDSTRNKDEGHTPMLDANTTLNKEEFGSST